jgi:hypothetical protein
MRTLCDACESAAAIVFCAADEATLCRSCDEKVLFFRGSSSSNYSFLVLVNLLGLVFVILPLILVGFLLRLLV